MSFDLPAGTILPVRKVRLALDHAPHPFETANITAIDDNWRCELAANPALFDGRMALLSSVGLDNGVLAGRCHIVRYATFLLWRRLRPVCGAGHAYAHAMPVGSDNALLAIRMASHTVSPGAVYFAAGSFEEEDFREGLVDADFNMRREVLEETGLDIASAAYQPGFHVMSQPAGAVLFRRYVFERTADELADAVRTYVAAQDNSEIAGPVVIRDAENLPEGLAPQMPPLVRWHFARK